MTICHKLYFHLVQKLKKDLETACCFKMSIKMSKQHNEYIRQDPITHILTRPDMYVGSKSFEPQTVYVWEDGKIVRKNINESRALKRTFVEILSNAMDNLERDKKMTYIKVVLDSNSCEIINDGSVIPIEINPKENMYNHTLIFGHLLSGSNYNDDQKRFTSGRNGLGAKLTNVLSTEFIVEGLDPSNKLKFTQTWTNNMRNTNGPKLTKTTRKTGYTSIKWKWDCDWFQKGMNDLTKDTIDMFAMLVLNASMVSGINVFLNGVKLPNKLSDYFSLFKDFDESSSKYMVKLENTHSKVFVVPSISREFEAISFVNGIQTKYGGKHVNVWVEAVCRPIIDKLKSSTITLKDIKPFFKFLIVTRVANPEFEGQEKNELVNPNLKVEPLTCLSKIMKWPIWQDISQLIQAKDNKNLAKTVATKSINIEGYSKANNSGGRKSRDCSLIICEGMSAKTFAIEGISYGISGVKGRDWFGIYPLRGKLLNTRNATTKTISANQVITNLIKVLGLSCSNPDDLTKLNYGRIYILTDADVDGIHIEGLLLNFFHCMFPKLLENSLVFSMKTPILKVSVCREAVYYFDEQTFHHTTLPKNANVKYLKGLGSSNSEDIKEVFGKKILKFVLDDNVDNVIKNAFDKNAADTRKKWLENYSPLLNQKTKTLDQEIDPIILFSISRLLNDELIKFFYDDCKRSIPSVFDGLKESQRKIIYAVKKRKLCSKIKVAQLGAYVAENTNYHHGEENLFKTIIKMAQGFPGSNNVPFFMEDGQFGSRLAGGEDAAKPRYIFTQPHQYVNKLFCSQDDHLLQYRCDDGDTVEPYYYVPIIPLLLVNGCIGIGTGWMCNSPLFNPTDVLKLSTLWMNGDNEELNKMIETLKPWYRNFKGTIQKISDGKFQTFGVFKQKISFQRDQQVTYSNASDVENGVVLKEIGRMYNVRLDSGKLIKAHLDQLSPIVPSKEIDFTKTIRITELPIGTWTNKFEEELKEWEKDGLVSQVKTYSTKESVDIEFDPTTTFDTKHFNKKMTSSLNLDNIVVFDKDEKIVRLCIRDIFDMWGKERLVLNETRKRTCLGNLESQIKLMSHKIKFINLVRTKNLVLTDDDEIIIRTLKDNILNISDDDIDYLRDLPNRLLTENERQKLVEKKIKFQKEFDTLSRKTAKDIWFDDINKLDI